MNSVLNRLFNDDLSVHKLLALKLRTFNQPDSKSSAIYEFEREIATPEMAKNSKASQSVYGRRGRLCRRIKNGNISRCYVM